MDPLRSMRQHSTHIAEKIVRSFCALVWLGALALLWMPRVAQASHLLSNVVLSYLLFWALVWTLSRTPPMLTAKRFALTTATLGLVVALLEFPAVVRLVDYRLVLPDPNFDRKNPWRAHPLNRPDREVLQIFKANHRLTGEQAGGDVARMWNLPPLGEYEYDYRTDHNGFRNESDLSRADIIVLGDSIVWAPFVPADDTMSTVLGRLQQCQVANLAQRGYGPQQELAVLKRFGLKLEPKVCIWTFFEGNDIDDLHRYANATADWDAHLDSVHSFRKRCFSRNALVLANELLRPYVGKTRQPYEVGGTVSSGLAAGQEMYFFYGGRRTQSHDPRSLDMIRAALAEAHELCAKHEITFVFVFVPTKFRFFGQLCETVPRSILRNWRIDDLPDQLARLTATISGDIRFLDLTPHFVRRAEQGTMLYWPDDTHWSIEGNRFAAEVLSDELNQIGIDRSRHGTTVSRGL